MKKSLFTTGILASLALILFSGCLEDHCERTQTFRVFDPVFKSLDEMRNDIQSADARDLENPGKIYFYQNYLLINERREGIHVIDNADPANPQNIGFIEIAGNLDIAVQNGILYADMYLDLLAIDISNPTSPQLLSRSEDVFQQYYPFQQGQGYIVDYIETEQSQTIDCSDGRFGSNWFWSGGAIFIDVAFDMNSALNESSIGGGTGIGGSMARFTITSGHLYTLDQWQMHVFNLLDPQNPALTASIPVSGQIETIFPQKNYLFIGANNGMYIYDNSNPANPEFVSQFAHANACDPVFVYGNYAFVTLRDGNECENFNNELDIVDITDIYNPQLVKVYPMDNHHGLSVVEDVLYLCDGESGLKVYDASDVERISDNLLSQEKGINSYDIIVLPYSKLAILIGSDGLYQYDATNPEDLKQLSKIPVN